MAEQQQLGQVTRWGEEQMVAFIKIWQSAKDIAEVVSKTGMSASSVYAKSRQCSKAGVQLKQLTRGSKINWDKIKADAGLVS